MPALTPTEEWPWPKPAYRFEAVQGNFIYEDETIPPQLPGLAPNLGLRPGKTWKGVARQLDELNRSGSSSNGDGSVYKLVFAGRHGQGHHNVAEDKFGTAAWDAKWSLLNGDGDDTWGPDPELTPLGIAQAQEVNKLWRQLLDRANDDPPPVPTMLFSSPMYRAAVTLRTTFDRVLLGSGGTFDGRPPLKPIARELWRETLGDGEQKHTCDIRSPKDVIRQRLPDFDVDSLPEQDELTDVSAAQMCPLYSTG